MSGMTILVYRVHVSKRAMAVRRMSIAMESVIEGTRVIKSGAIRPSPVVFAEDVRTEVGGSAEHAPVAHAAVSSVRGAIASIAAVAAVATVATPASAKVAVIVMATPVGVPVAAAAIVTELVVSAAAYFVEEVRIMPSEMSVLSNAPFVLDQRVRSMAAWEIGMVRRMYERHVDDAAPFLMPCPPVAVLTSTINTIEPIARPSTRARTARANGKDIAVDFPKPAAVVEVSRFVMSVVHSAKSRSVIGILHSVVSTSAQSR